MVEGSGGDLSKMYKSRKRTKKKIAGGRLTSKRERESYEVGRSDSEDQETTVVANTIVVNTIVAKC